MKLLSVSIILVATLITGCKNPLGSGSAADSNFLPGFVDSIQSHIEAHNLVLLSEPGDAIAGQSLGSIQVQVRDKKNVPLTSGGITVTAEILSNSGGSTLIGTTSQETVNGVATFNNLALTKVGSNYNLVFSATLVASVTSANFSISPAPVSAAQSTLGISVTPVPADGTSAHTITATIRDSFGNPVPGQAVIFAATGTGNTFSQPALLTNAGGQTSGSMVSTHAGSKTISFAVPSVLSAVTTTAVFSSFATQLAILTQPASSQAGQTLGTIQVQLRDAASAAVLENGRAVTVTLQTNPGSSTLAGTTTVNTINGVATFSDLYLNKVGAAYSLTFKSSGLTSITSQTFNITPSVPSSTQSTLVLNPTTYPADNISTSTITLTLKDAYGNLIPGQSVVFTATGSGNTLTQPSAVTNASGQAVGSIKSSQSGTKTVSLSTPTGMTALTANVAFTALTNFTETFTFGTSSTNYTLSTSTLQYNSTNIAHKILTLDADNSSSQFGGALSLTNVEWNSGAIKLSAAGLTAKTGNFESRIMAAPSAMNWTSLVWQSYAPAGKKYPDNKATETGFASGNLNMSSNVLLMHFDEDSWTTAAGQAIDSSGSGNNGDPYGNVSTSSTAKFGRGGNFTTVGQYVTVPHSATLDSSTQMSWEAWIYPTNVDGNPRPIVSKRLDSTSQNAYSIFIYQSAKMAIDIAGTGANQRFDTGYTMSANTWYHIAATFDGALSSNRLKFYVNGTLVSQHQPSANAIPATNSTAVFTVGAMNSNPNTFLGTIDELAIYERTLSATEISTRYNRGLRRVKFQARGCANSNCSDGTFVGPDGTSSTYFTELLNTGLTNTTTATLPSAFNSKQYFQYKAIMESDNSVQNPQLLTVAAKPDLYDPAYPMVTNIATFSYLTLTGFSATETGTVHYQISNNGSNWYYWNGSSWTSATLGYSHSNTKTDINTNIGSFPATAQGNFYVRAFFDAGTNATSPASLTSISVTGAR